MSLTWKDANLIIEDMFSLNAKAIADYLGVNSSTINRVKNGITQHFTLTPKEIFEKIFDPTNEKSPANKIGDEKYLFAMFKETIEKSGFSNVMDDMWELEHNKSNYKEFVVKFLKRVKWNPPSKDKNKIKKKNTVCSSQTEMAKEDDSVVTAGNIDNYNASDISLQNTAMDTDDIVELDTNAPESSSENSSPHEAMLTKINTSVSMYKFFDFIKSEPLQAFTIATDIEEKQLKVDYFQYMREEQLASPLSAFGLDDFSYLDDDLIKNSIISYSCRQLKAELLIMNERFVDFIYNEIIGSSSDNRKEPIYDAINDFAKKLDDYINYLKKHLDVDGEYLVPKEDYTTSDNKHSDESTHNTKRAIQSQMMWFYSSTRYLREEVYSLFMKIQEVDISTSVFSNYD